MRTSVYTILLTLPAVDATDSVVKIANFRHMGVPTPWPPPPVPAGEYSIPDVHQAPHFPPARGPRQRRHPNRTLRPNPRPYAPRTSDRQSTRLNSSHLGL